MGGAAAPQVKVGGFFHGWKLEHIPAPGTGGVQIEGAEWDFWHLGFSASDLMGFVLKLLFVMSHSVLPNRHLILVLPHLSPMLPPQHVIGQQVADRETSG
jgi:hypothetical protein